jgi:hypothetical protein
VTVYTAYIKDRFLEEIDPILPQESALTHIRQSQQVSMPAKMGSCQPTASALLIYIEKPNVY